MLACPANGLLPTSARCTTRQIVGVIKHIVFSMTDYGCTSFSIFFFFCFNTDQGSRIPNVLYGSEQMCAQLTPLLPTVATYSNPPKARGMWSLNYIITGYIRIIPVHYWHHLCGSQDATTVYQSLPRWFAGFSKWSINPPCVILCVKVLDTSLIVDK